MSAVISRTVPADFPLGADVFEAFAFSQNISVGSLLAVSGVMPVHGTLAAIQLVEGDIRAQTLFSIDALHRSLKAADSGFDRLVSLTIYTTDIDALASHADIFRDAFGANPPAATWVQVARLFHPQQMVEITALAAK